MADLKISQLTGASTPLAGTEVLPIVQSGSTVKVSVANLTAGRAVASAGGTFSDNFVQGTAAKGVNFTANTPAAGMTSQLLNWYEEGTWTPSVTASSGAITTLGTVTGKYTRIGRQVTVHFSIAITTNGTGAGSILATGLPFTISGVASGCGRENGSTGDMLNVTGANGSTTLGIVNYNNSYPGGSGYNLQGFATYTV
jgi:hypothetical protein